MVRRRGPDGLLCDGPILKPAQWIRHVNGLEIEAELKVLGHSLARGTPFGDTHWQTKTAAMLGLESSLRPRGRSRQQEKQNVFFVPRFIELVDGSSRHNSDQHADMIEHADHAKNIDQDYRLSDVHGNVVQAIFV